MNSEGVDYPMTSMFESCRLAGRLFYLLVSLLLACGVARAVPPPAGGQNYAANSTVQVKVLTAGAGCTTNASDVNVTVQYKMQ